MCGILGVVSSKPSLIDLSSALDRLQHRGPDQSGSLYWDAVGGRLLERPGIARVALGHQRLSIIDLSLAGRQPMVARSLRFAIIFNGEVYNYLELRSELSNEGCLFSTTTDTEVVIQAIEQWGLDTAICRFRGMFAFAVLDLCERKVLLARDPFGIKPLYYCVSNGSFFFASEIPALIHLSGTSKNLDVERVFQYLRFGLTDHGDGTMFASVRQLPVASYGTLELDAPEQLCIRRYWSPTRRPHRDLRLPESATLVREAFLRNIELHLRSDVPVGMALSGGIDSSAIVGAVRHLRPDLEIHSFSYIPDTAALSEEPWIDRVTQDAKVISHKVSPGPHDLIRDLDSLITCQGEPFGSTRIYAQYRVFQLARESGIKVMLDGQGADELLAGYTPYQAYRLASLIRQGEFRRAWHLMTAQAIYPDRSRLRMLVTSGEVFLPRCLLSVARQIVGRAICPPWLNLSWFRDRGLELHPPVFDPRQDDCLRAKLVESIETTMLPHLLRYEDRNSMRFSIESRVPFLTTDFADLVLSLPEEHLIDDAGVSKTVFRTAMKGIVPDCILARRDKIGFATPEGAWLKECPALLKETVSRAEMTGVLNPGGVAAYFESSFSRDRYDDFGLWRIVNFVRWLTLADSWS